MTTLNDARATEKTGWDSEDSARLYRTDAWGAGYFTVTPRGTLAVRPDQCEGRSIDLHEVVEGLYQRGVTTPVLLRLPQILDHRMTKLRSAFDDAIADQSYGGSYRCIYPIKVNQQRTILEETVRLASKLNFGLEAGSKPELLAVMGMTCGAPTTPIVCNGFKDDEYIETVILAAKLGRDITPVVEKYSELGLVIKHAEAHGVRPKIGLRVKIASEGSGRWQSSAGSRSKFGLFMAEALSALEELQACGMGDCLRMLHFHIGSQVCDIRKMKKALTELAYVYCELRRLGATGLDTIDVGGGLAVDYDGSQTDFESSMNYTLEEYAADVVYRIASVCDEAGQPHPTIYSESGRALTAYASMLIVDVLGVSRFDSLRLPAGIEAQARSSEETPKPVLDLLNARDSAAECEVLEVLHDVTQAREEAMSLFGLGYLELPMRALSERLYWSIASDLLRRAERERAEEDALPEEIESLRDQLSDIYFCNFSVFQSAPDSWAIDQIFPVCPIHRLDEEPTRRGVIADITCDSDGKIDRFPDRADVKRSLELHELREGDPYYLGVFLVGAYQEILGDLHNLLGDTNAAHVSVHEDGSWRIDEIVHGDTVADVMSYVQIDAKQLRREMRQSAEVAVREGRLSVAESRRLLKFYEAGLEGYTYLEE